MARDKLETIAVWTVVVLILGCLIYFLPMLFIGLCIGYAIGLYKDRISAWAAEGESFLKDDED